MESYSKLVPMQSRHLSKNYCNYSIHSTALHTSHVQNTRILARAHIHTHIPLHRDLFMSSPFDRLSLLLSVDIKRFSNMDCVLLQLVAHTYNCTHCCVNNVGEQVANCQKLKKKSKSKAIHVYIYYIVSNDDFFFLVFWRLLYLFSPQHLSTAEHNLNVHGRFIYLFILHTILLMHLE